MTISFEKSARENTNENLVILSKSVFVGASRLVDKQASNLDALNLITCLFRELQIELRLIELESETSD